MEKQHFGICCAMLNAACTAFYEAKDIGRNRVDAWPVDAQTQAYEATYRS